MGSAAVAQGAMNERHDKPDPATAVGGGSRAQAEWATSLGGNTAMQGRTGTSLGNSTLTNHELGVSLGANSRTDETVKTRNIHIAGKNYDYTGSLIRTITNLGAGQIDATSTDGINGSQLYATNQAVESINDRIKDINQPSGQNALSWKQDLNAYDAMTTAK